MMDEILFLTVEDVMAIHRRVVAEFGGDAGLRDRGLLESATAMPQARFSGSYLHAGLAEMAAAYHYHLCCNHAFVDGNKRVAVAAAEVFLLVNGSELLAPDEELEEMTLELASGRVSKDEVVAFYRRYATGE